jgi:hypothetical protein
MIEDSPTTGSESADTHQQELLKRAVQRGYFETPRECSLVQLSQEIGIDDVEASEQLRRGIKQYVTSDERIDNELSPIDG